MKPSSRVITHVEITVLNINDERARPRVRETSERSVVSPTEPFRTIRTAYLWCACVLLLFLSPPVDATTIIVQKTMTEIFAAADSKIVHPTGESDSTMDKIVEIKPGWYVAAAGKLQIGTGLIFNDFDVFKSVSICNLLMGSTGSSASALSMFAPMTLREFATRCSQQISSELLTPLERLNRQNPDLYAKYIANQVIVELVFFGKEADGLKLYVRDIFPQSLGLIAGLTEVRSADCETACAATAVLGYYEHITPLEPVKISNEVTICRLVVVEIDKHPDVVGWPVKVLHLTASGTVEWFNHEKACEEKKTQPSTPTPKPTKRRRKRPAA
jgi:hypothetical protein